MDLYVSSQSLAEIEGITVREDAAAGVRAAAMVELAWHLRQRDSARALQLSGEAELLLAGQPAMPVLRLRTALLRCEIAALFSQLDAAEEQLVQARELLCPELDPFAAGDALLAEALVAKARGQRERELDAYDRAVVFCEGDPDRLAAAKAWSAYERSFSDPHAADAVPAQHAHPAIDSLCCAARAITLSRRDPVRSGELFLHAAEQAQRAGLVRHAVVCLLNAGSALQGLSDYDQAAASYEVAASVARRCGWPALVGSSDTRLGAFLKELGRLDEACRVLRGALDTLAVTPAGINKANAASALAQALLAMGRGVEAVGPMAEAIRMYREAQSTDNLALNLIGHARALSAAGEPQAALEALAESQALIERHGFSALFVGVCEALAEIHQRHSTLPTPEGMSLPNAALHYAEMTLAEGQRIAAWKAPASLYVFLGECWAAAGDMARAYDYACRALRVKEQEAALSLSHPLAVLRLREAGEAAATGLPAVDASGLWRPVEAAGEGQALPQPQTLSAKLLTPKEREIMQLLARSYSNKEIASALEMGEETVKWHLKKMYTKLQAGSRKHAVTRARTLGVISFSS